jgi:type I restriction enzyme S subunit
MSSEFVERTLGDVAFISSGKRPSTISKERSPDAQVKIVGGGGPSGFTNQSLTSDPVLITGRVGTLGKLYIYQEPVWPSDNALVIRPRQEVVSFNYLRYALGRVIYLAIGMNRGAANPLVTQSDLSKLVIPVPHAKVQAEIAAVLSSLDDRITLLRETNQTLEAIAQALFKSWFVDFEPVRAKAEGRLPEGIDAATATLFPDAFQETKLGMVPKGWTYVQFGELISQTIGGDWGSDVADEKNDTRVAIIRGTDIPDLQDCANNRVPIRFTTQKKLATRKLEDGDLVLEVSGGSKDQPTGRSLHITTALLEQFDCPVEPASFCRLMRPINKKIGSLLSQHMSYIYAQGKTWEYQNQSTGIANFQTTHFLQNEMVVRPSEAVLNAFVETVQKLMDRARTLETVTLSNLRDTLLPRLISGQLRIADAEKELEKATA